ncbi:SEL1-like repeat protein [Salinimonas chungwhensis]|uniref:sel1 repeat family protein n=1 Tax=Salinimonas chungwhensis TaxID=265425 RepID=UPI00036FFB29|nr:sel1 repeat family protein [Salinimonas chungwhensis]
MRGLVIALLAMVLVSADSSFHLPQLLENARDAAKPEPLLWQASLRGSKQAQRELVLLSIKTQNKFWLAKLVGLRNPEAAWALYELDKNSVNSERLLNLAARGDVPAAQLELAMASDSISQRETWLVRAAQNDHAPAQAALADLYLLSQAAEKARPWLIATAQAYPQSAFQLGRMLFEEGQTEQGTALLRQASNDGHKMASRLLTIIKEYSVQTPDAVTLTPWPEDRKCAQKIQMFATSLSSIERASQLYESFLQDERLETLPLCLQAPIWLSQNSIDCSSDWQRSGRMGCDIRQLAKPVEATQATHVILVGDAGKANVNNGIMYLDLSDSYSVMVHELAHFAGFVDEYPLAENIAEQYCHGAKVPNLVFDGRLTYRPQSTLAKWLSLKPSTGIANASSCRALGVNAYKPSRQITFMEHHDSGVIPKIYLALWKQQLLKPDQQRPVFMNLFQRFHYAGDQQRAGEWLARYNAFNALPDTEQPAD